MDMSSMLGGMDMSSEGPFRPTNEKLAHALWYCIAGAVGLLTVSRGLNILESRRRRSLANDPKSSPYRPHGPICQAIATTRAVFREMAYPQPIYFTGRISKLFSPLPVGRWFILICYWILLLCFLWSDTILSPDNPMYAYKWEKVAFRAAWISISQIPFIYLLSCKFNPISMLTGISYERFNWLHRWAARTVFLTIIVHWSFFFREWWLADFVKFEIEMMPMVKYGFGAWSVIGWMVLSGFGFFRNLNYEIFVAQHICAAATLLWLLHTHVPSYAAYNIWISVGFVAFDWSARIIWALVRNLHIMDRIRARTPGYTAQLEALSGDMVRVTIEEPGFKWRAGQHAYLTVPRLGPLEMHPFTIASTPDEKHLSMLIKAHSGFSRRLKEAALKPGNSETTYRAFLSGPWGLPPDLRHYDTVVLIACSSGMTFVSPVLRELLNTASCVREFRLHWIIRNHEHLEWFRRELVSLRDTDAASTASLRIAVHVTGEDHGAVEECREDSKTDIEQTAPQVLGSSSDEASISQSSNPFESEKGPIDSTSTYSRQENSASMTMKFGGRPTVDTMIRPPVEAALGETAVIVCGGLAITAQARTFVAALSDERAIHKGSGAQGIFLFTETYGW